MVVATLGSCHHQAWVQHVTLLLGSSVDMGAPASDLPPIHGDGGVDGHRIGLQRPGLGALTLDLPTLGISGPTQQRRRQVGEMRGKGRNGTLQNFSLSCLE